ncbi:MAG: DivIVA domain-containing protein [Bdellovibrionales bacterium]
MKIAPIDIAHKSFKQKWMGIDGDEVTDFLRAVAEEMELLIKEKNELRERMREKELSLMEFKERDQVLKDTITTAHKMAENIRSDAEREAKLITNDANQKAEIIVKDARDSLKKIYQEIGDLKRVRMAFETRLKSMLQSYLSILDEENKDFLDPVGMDSKSQSPRL